MAKRSPYKPPVDSICDLNAFSPGSTFTPAEFRRNALSHWFWDSAGKIKASEEGSFFKWAKRYKLIVPVPGGKYQLTRKGTHVAKKACKR
jgi:hypothetical protein